MKKLRILISDNGLTEELLKSRALQPGEAVLGMEWDPHKHELHAHVKRGVGQPDRLLLERGELLNLLRPLGVIYIVGVYQNATTGCIEVHVCSQHDPRVSTGGFAIPYKEGASPPWITLRSWSQAGLKLHEIKNRSAAASELPLGMAPAEKKDKETTVDPVPFKFNEDHPQS